MGDHAVDQEFVDIKRGGFGSNVASVYNMASHDGDAPVVWILFFGSELAHYLCDSDSFVEIVWDVVKMDDGEGVGDFDALAGAGRAFAYAMA